MTEGRDVSVSLILESVLWRVIARETGSMLIQGSKLRSSGRRNCSAGRLKAVETESFERPGTTL